MIKVLNITQWSQMKKFLECDAPPWFYCILLLRTCNLPSKINIFQKIRFPPFKYVFWASRVDLDAYGQMVKSAELAFSIFLRVVSLDDSFYFPPVPCQFQLQRTRYDQNTTRTSWCKKCGKIDFVDPSKNLSRSFSDHFFDFLLPTKHIYSFPKDHVMHIIFLNIEILVPQIKSLKSSM